MPLATQRSLKLAEHANLQTPIQTFLEQLPALGWAAA